MVQGFLKSCYIALGFLLGAYFSCPGWGVFSDDEKTSHTRKLFISGSCLDFGTLSLNNAYTRKYQTFLQVATSPGENYSVSLDTGMNAANVECRRLAHIKYPDVFLNYILCQDLRYTKNWGNTLDVDTVLRTGVGGWETLYLYGHAQGSDNTVPGCYTDTLCAIKRVGNGSTSACMIEIRATVSPMIFIDKTLNFGSLNVPGKFSYNAPVDIDLKLFPGKLYTITFDKGKNYDNALACRAMSQNGGVEKIFYTLHSYEYTLYSYENVLINQEGVMRKKVIGTGALQKQFINGYICPSSEAFSAGIYTDSVLVEVPEINLKTFLLVTTKIEPLSK